MYYAEFFERSYRPMKVLQKMPQPSISYAGQNYVCIAKSAPLKAARGVAIVTARELAVARRAHGFRVMRESGAQISGFQLVEREDG